MSEVARKSWRVEWVARYGKPAAVSSDSGPNDAKAKASRYFGCYDANTKYHLYEYVETKRELEVFDNIS